MEKERRSFKQAKADYLELRLKIIEAAKKLGRCLETSHQDFEKSRSDYYALISELDELIGEFPEYDLDSESANDNY